VRAIPIVAAYALRESVRRKVFVVVLALTIAFLGLYWLGVVRAFEEARGFGGPTDSGVEIDVVVGSTLFGLSMFATLFLGTVLAVFLTLGAVRGDAERGLLQPLVVRPVGRATLLLGRFVGASSVCAAYVLAVYAAALLITRAAGDGYLPDRIVTPGLGLAAAVTIIAAMSLLGSVFLASTANGIAVFMIFGAGLTGGLLSQIGEALNSDDLEQIADAAAWVLPFEALYQGGLQQLTAETGGLTETAINLGPFGGAEALTASGIGWAVLYAGGLVVFGLRGFSRRDL
jgi:Cu-processing system permease protein